MYSPTSLTCVMVQASTDTLRIRIYPDPLALILHSTAKNLPCFRHAYPTVGMADINVFGPIQGTFLCQLGASMLDKEVSIAAAR